MLKILFFTLVLLPISLQAIERTTIRLSLSGSNLNLRQLNSNNHLVTNGSTLSNAVVELSVPASLVSPDRAAIDPLELISTWKRAYPADFVQQSGVSFQPIKIIRSATPTPNEGTVYASIEFQLKRPGTRARILDENTKVNTDNSCAWIEDQIPNHAPIHQLAATEGEFQCAFCDYLLQPEAFNTIRGVVNKVRENYSLPLACVQTSMTRGRDIIKSRFQRCNNDNNNQKAFRVTCVTPELMKYNQAIMVNTAMCFGLNPKLLLPMVHHESRFFSNIQAAGGDTGFTQLTGPFVKEMDRLYGEDLRSFEKVSGSSNSACNGLKQEYENNLPLINATKSQRCSWMNPVTNLVLATAHFRDVFRQQADVINEFAKDAFANDTQAAILSMVATHSHHIPSSKSRLRFFLNSPQFKKMQREHASRGEKISLDTFTNEYKKVVRGNAGSYFKSVLKDYNELSGHQAGCGW